MIKTLFLHEISRRCLFLYHVHVFRISVTGMPFLLLFLLHSAAVAAWCVIQRVDPQMIHFQIFYHLVRRSQFNPQTIFGWFSLGIHPKKIIIPVPFHSKAFVLLYKFETRWALLGRLSRSFFFLAISGASNFKHSLFMNLFWTSLSTYVRASSSSLLFCI